jgi:hypothetical protein
MQNREERKDRAQSDNQEDDSAVVMKPSIQESRIHVSSEFSNHEDAETILCHRKWNGDQDENKIPPPGSQEQMRQNHGRDHQQTTGADAATFLCHFNIESREREKNPISLNGFADCPE